MLAYFQVYELQHDCANITYCFHTSLATKFVVVLFLLLTNLNILNTMFTSEATEDQETNSHNMNAAYFQGRPFFAKYYKWYAWNICYLAKPFVGDRLEFHMDFFPKTFVFGWVSEILYFFIFLCCILKWALILNKFLRTMKHEMFPISLEKI